MVKIIHPVRDSEKVSAKADPQNECPNTNNKDSCRQFDNEFQRKIISTGIQMRCKDSASSGLRENEEQKDYGNQMILASRPLRSGELVCDEELQLEDSYISNIPNERENTIRAIRALFSNTQGKQ